MGSHRFFSWLPSVSPGFHWVWIRLPVSHRHSGQWQRFLCGGAWVSMSTQWAALWQRNTNTKSVQHLVGSCFIIYIKHSVKNKWYQMCLQSFYWNWLYVKHIYTICDIPSICKSGKWTCTEKRCPGTCVIYGSGHYRTFDQQAYAFQGHCGYVAVKVNKTSKTF